jgi:hypothetical protein
MNGIIHHHIQLLCARWFPATFNRPKTVFTFDCLDTFYELTLQGKTTLYDFYHMVLHKLDNLELKKPVVGLSLKLFMRYCWTNIVIQYRYPEFHRAIRIWRNLLMLKRAGRGQDPAGVDATASGELAVECPACPHPGRNLPEDCDFTGALSYVLSKSKSAVV